MMENGLDQVIQAKLKSDTTKEQIMKELLQWHDSNNSISEGIERALLDCNEYFQPDRYYHADWSRG